MTTTADRQRYGRQTRLAEIGPSGQAKLSAAKVAVCSSGFVRTIEHRYVLGAGMTPREADEGTEAVPSVDPAEVDRLADVASLGLRHGPAREVAEGSLRALVAIRHVLGVDS